MSSRFRSQLDRARELADSGTISRSPSGGYYVPSPDGVNTYHVQSDEHGEPFCPCRGWHRLQPCYHAIACGLIAKREAAAV